MHQNRPISTRTILATSLGAIALVLGVAVQPAAAANVTSVIGNAYGYRAFNISLFGGAQSDTGPTPQVTLASNASNSPQTASATCGRVVYGPAVLFTSDTIAVSTSGSLGPSGSATASTSISKINMATNTACNGVNETGGEIFTANSLAGTVTAFNNGTKTAATSVSSGTYNVHSNSFNCTSLATNCGGHTHDAGNPEGTTAVSSMPGANTKVAGHVHLNDTTTDYFVIVFNEQVNNADGSLTVNPVHEYFGATLDGSNNIVDDPNSILQGDLILGRATAGRTAV
ncbi:MAG: hypothetical protein ACRD12_10520 [Acidimicrobiales bacterium]